MDRSDLTIIPPDTAWLKNAPLQSVCRAISIEGAKIYFVGGCVRDAILGVQGSDIDLATDATPHDVTRLARAADFKVVPTGIEHGTVTVIANGTGYEITTFRKDVKTHGRRAEVEFCADIASDAARRDFTLNALYATPQGEILDPLGTGVEDCLARRIKFIEDAGARIREDYLRILRYFRFHAWYADREQGFDADALDAVAQNAQGLESLSGERIGAEMRKLLSAPDPTRVVATMQQTGTLQRILPGSDSAMLFPVVHLEARLNAPPDWRLRLAALDGDAVSTRLRLSRRDAEVLDRLRAAMGDMMPVAEVAYRYGVEIASGALVLRAVLANQPLEPAALIPLETAAQAQFPVKAKDLMPGLSGKALGERLDALERHWVASDFQLTRDELMTLE
ncbi:MAG: CCA tRNA nucleotidyltransferase [Paracoccaceae bacterium]|nr:CCA tRNA nucleotidyltransferase [Paracoccaceae bacterium]